MFDFDDNYDDSYVTCHDVGIMGNCSFECPVLLRGECPIGVEMIENMMDCAEPADTIGEFIDMYDIPDELFLKFRIDQL